jgi:hypothetical protein
MRKLKVVAEDGQEKTAQSLSEQIALILRVEMPEGPKLKLEELEALRQIEALTLPEHK